MHLPLNVLLEDQKFKLWLNRSEVSTLNPVDASGLTIWSTNAGPHKINAPTLKPFSRSQVKDKLKEACLIFWRDVPSDQLNADGFEEGKLT